MTVVRWLAYLVVYLDLQWSCGSVRGLMGWEVTGQIVVENAKSGLVRAVRVRWRGSVARVCAGCVAGCDLRVPA